MRLAAWLAALVLAAAAPVLAQVAYTPAEADFSVAFPSTPQAQSQPAKRMSDAAFRRYVAQTPDGAFLVGIDLYPDGVLPPSPNAAVYERLLQSHARDGQIPLVSTRPARLAGRPCLEGTFQDGDGNVEVVRVLMLGDRIYRLTYAHAAARADSGEGAAFFASFRLP